MSIKLLESIQFESDEELTKKAFAPDTELKRELKEKYKGKNISFQTTSLYSKKEYFLNVFEKIID